MRTNQYIGISILLLSHQVCMAQPETTSTVSTSSTTSYLPRPESVPIVVIQVDTKSLELNAKESEQFRQNSKSINHTSGIQSITVLKDKAAEDKYGIRGKNGVVIVLYRDEYKLPWNIQMKFMEAK